MNSKQPIFLLGAHKSGTSLLRSIFDGHKDLFTVPIEAHFFQNLGWWIEYPFRRNLSKPYSQADFKFNIKNFIRNLNKSEDYQADSITKDLFDEILFDEFVDAHLKNNMPLNEVFFVYVAAIYLSIFKKKLSSEKRIVEKTVENFEFAVDLSKMFPDAIFFHIVRNPYANLVSLRKYKTKKKGSWIGPIFKALLNNYYYLEKNQRVLDNYYVIKYEELVSDPLTIVKSICKSANIEFINSMLNPTFLGKDWTGNSTYSIKFSGISNDTLHQWRNQITPLEVDLVNKNFLYLLNRFDYDKFEIKKSVFWPSKQESIKNYIANRIYWKIKA